MLTRTGARRAPSVPRITLATLVASALLVGANTATAASTPEQQCQKGRYDAAAKYEACEAKAVSRLFGTGDTNFDINHPEFEPAVSRCRIKYTATWTKLQARATGTGSTCDGTRSIDNGDGTVTDRLTGLQWEQKADDASVHDKDDVYTWTDTGVGNLTDADGTAYTTFLASLNGGACFAGQCDWRLPTVYEQQTILLEPYPCTTNPCIDQDLFGPTAANFYWSSTTLAVTPKRAWAVSFGNGAVENGFGQKDVALPVRAVRGGL